VERILLSYNLVRNIAAFLQVGGKHVFYHRLGGKLPFVHLSYLIHPKKASTFVLSWAGSLTIEGTIDRFTM
jgi:hypothetical protein